MRRQYHHWQRQYHFLLNCSHEYSYPHLDAQFDPFYVYTYSNPHPYTNAQWASINSNGNPYPDTKGNIIEYRHEYGGGELSAHSNAHQNGDQNLHLDFHENINDYLYRNLRGDVHLDLNFNEDINKYVNGDGNRHGDIHFDLNFNDDIDKYIYRYFDFDLYFHQHCHKNLHSDNNFDRD